MLNLKNSVSFNLVFSVAWIAIATIAFAQEDGGDTLNTGKQPAAKSPAKGNTAGKASSGKSTPQKDNRPQEDETATTSGIEFIAPRKMEMQFGMRFFSNDNFCSNMHATIPFPLNWPEQKVTVLNSEIPQGVLYAFRDLPIGAKQQALARQLVMDIAMLGPNNKLDLVVKVEIEKSFIDPPADPSVFVIPKKIGNELRFFVGKGSPYIDHELGEVRRVAKQIVADNPDNAWTHVERLYDWVRDNVEYRKGKIRHMKDTLKDKKGDCEEMTGLFVALCRASNIPARCVWVPEHCYCLLYTSPSPRDS